MLRLPQRQALERKEFFSYDYSAGLDLRRQGLNPEPKHSPDALDVDWNVDGGWCTRKTLLPFNVDNFTSKVSDLNVFELPPSSALPSGANWVVVSFADGSVRTIVGGAGNSSANILPATTTVRRMAEVNYAAIFHGHQAAVRWTVAGLATQGNAFNSNYNARTGGNVPWALHGTVFAGYYWVFDTMESNVRNANRCRFSFPLINLGGDGDWHPDDYIDINLGEDGEGITAIATTGPRILVFKEHHTFEIVRNSTTKFEVNVVSSTKGASGPEAVAVVGAEVYAWDSVAGAHRIIDVPNSYGRYVFSDDAFFDPLRPLVIDGVIPVIAGGVSCVNAGDRVIFSVPVLRTGQRRSYVWSTVQNNWTAYSYQLGASTVYSPVSGKSSYLAVSDGASGVSRIVRLNEAGGGAKDDYGFSLVPMQAFVQTPWLSGPDIFRKKLWECTTLVLDGVDPIDVEVRRDFQLDPQMSEAAAAPAAGSFFLNNVKLAGAEGSGYPSREFDLEEDITVIGGIATKFVGVLDLGGGSARLARSTASDYVELKLPRCETRALQFIFRVTPTVGSQCLRAQGLRYKNSARTC